MEGKKRGREEERKGRIEVWEESKGEIKERQGRGVTRRRKGEIEEKRGRRGGTGEERPG